MENRAAWAKLAADAAVMAATLSGGEGEEEAEQAEIEAAEMQAEADATVDADAEGAEGAGRNPAQDKLLSRGEIKKLQDAGHDVHDLKPGKGTDLYKDQKGNIYVKPKGGVGPGDPTGININDL